MALAGIKNAPSRFTRLFVENFRQFGHTESRDFRYEVTLSLWARWFLLAGCLIETSYRVEIGLLNYILNNLYVVAMMAANGYVHYRLRSERRVPIIWVLALTLMDVAALSFTISLSGGFHSRYFVLLYPATAMFAWVFTSPYLGFSWATSVAAIYVVLCLSVGDGIDFEKYEEKTLFYRVFAMYGVLGFVNILTRFERRRRLEAAEFELGMRQERIELSQTIHDTVAQHLYLIWLGVESARDQVKETTSALAERLQSVHTMSQLAIWELRHPIDSARVFETPELSTTLSSHVATFNTISGLPTEFVQTGHEPNLSPVSQGLLFAIAHNALTNVLRHAQASRVEVSLDFRADHLRLSVRDDGVGMPTDRESQGHGLRNMSSCAQRLGGRLEISEGIGGAGTRVTCEAPYDGGHAGASSASDGSDRNAADRRS